MARFRQYGVSVGSSLLTPRPLSPFWRGGTTGEDTGGVMDKVLRRRLEMAERVRDFLRAHQTDGVGEGLGLAKLEELLQRAQVLAGQQRVGVAMTRQATKQREE